MSAIDLIVSRSKGVLVVASSAALLVGCTESGFGQFDGNVVAGPECIQDFFPFESDFQTAQESESNASLFFQSDGGTPQGKDVIAFVHSDPDLVTPGTTFDVEPAELREESRFSGQILAEQSCPETNLSYYITGKLTIDEYSGEDETNVAGSFSDGQVIDARTDAVVVTDLTGSWEFTFQTGPPYEPYP